MPDASDDKGKLRLHSDRRAQKLDEYLSDTAPPMLVAEPIAELLDADPKAAHQVILRWADQQLDATLHAIPISDFFFHALKKIQLLEELGLVDPERIRRLLASTAHVLRAY